VEGRYIEGDHFESNMVTLEVGQQLDPRRHGQPDLSILVSPFVRLPETHHRRPRVKLLDSVPHFSSRPGQLMLDPLHCRMLQSPVRQVNVTDF
jgi:hypothetical protein